MCYRSLLCGLHPSRIKSSTTVFLLLFCSLGPLYAVNCLSHIHTQLGPDCTLEVTPSMVLSDPTIDPADVVIEVSYGSGIVINDGVLRMQHIGRDIKVKITCIASDCDGGVCWTKIDLSADIPPVFGPALDTAVYCYDSLLLADPADGSYPFSRRLLASCANSSGPHFVADWIEVRDCGVDADTAKIIYREWYAESKLGTRVVAFDTIAVLRLPAIEVALHCPSSDTSYCDAPEEPFGPYLLVENPPGSGLCDTFYLLSMEAEQVSNGLKCGLNWKVETHDFDTDCGSMTAYDVEIVQNCFSSNTACAADAPPEVTIIGGQRQHATCSFWHMVLDTLGPEVHCVPGKDTLMQGDTVITIISSGSHDCLADLFLPSAVVTDLCNAPKYVKAKVDSTETVVYLPAGGDLWQPESSVA
ncbi:MAG: hypothetical protein KTR24_05555, partial [Saprospiraceae bacterium]|nr:hypothetical protein [Saprospiraceae bacterium]